MKTDRKIHKLSELYTFIVEQEPVDTSGIDPHAEEESDVVLLINQLEQQPEVIQQLRSLQLPTSKYKAIKEFARLLGISDEEFHSAIEQMKIFSTQ